MTPTKVLYPLLLASPVFLLQCLMVHAKLPGDKTKVRAGTYPGKIVAYLTEDAKIRCSLFRHGFPESGGDDFTTNIVDGSESDDTKVTTTTTPTEVLETGTEGTTTTADEKLKRRKRSAGSGVHHASEDTAKVYYRHIIFDSDNSENITKETVSIISIFNDDVVYSLTLASGSPLTSGFSPLPYDVTLQGCLSPDQCEFELAEDEIGFLQITIAAVDIHGVQDYTCEIHSWHPSGEDIEYSKSFQTEVVLPTIPDIAIYEHQNDNLISVAYELRNLTALAYLPH